MRCLYMPIKANSDVLSVVCVCVCVWERERERESRQVRMWEGEIRDTSYMKREKSGWNYLHSWMSLPHFIFSGGRFRIQGFSGGGTLFSFFFSSFPGTIEYMISPFPMMFSYPRIIKKGRPSEPLVVSPLFPLLTNYCCWDSFPLPKRGRHRRRELH